jgi:hypothetical protein
MKILRYEFNGCIKSFPWTARGEELAAKEAENGEYSVIDITEEEAEKMGFVVNKEPSADDVINTLLGVAK